MGLFKFRKYEDVSAKESLLSSHSSRTYREAYRTLSANIEQVANEKKMKNLMITSAIGNEGKSTVGINLALAFANQGLKILLINADWRNKKFNKFFNIPTDKKGFYNIFNDLSNFESSIFHDKNTKVDLLHSGIKRRSNISITKTKAFYNFLEEKYDLLITISPTVNAYADAVILAQCVDGVLLTVKQNGATSQEVFDAIDELRLAGANIIGTVFTHCDSMKRSAILKKYNRLYVN